MEQSNIKAECASTLGWQQLLGWPVGKLSCGVLKGAQPPHIQASTSSSSPVCITIATILHRQHEVLFDSDSGISSINQDLVDRLNLATSKAPSIKVLFGDHQHLYKSNTTVVCTLKLGSTTITHIFYVLPHQLFPLTLGCDWFIQSRAQLDFDTRHLTLPQARPFPLFTSKHDHQISNAQVVRTKRKDRVTKERYKEITRKEEWNDKRGMKVLR